MFERGIISDEEQRDPGREAYSYTLNEQHPAAVLDGSGYAARLVVLPTFGCVLHEPR